MLDTVIKINPSCNFLSSSLLPHYQMGWYDHLQKHVTWVIFWGSSQGQRSAGHRSLHIITWKILLIPVFQTGIYSIICFSLNYYFLSVKTSPNSVSGATYRAPTYLWLALIKRNVPAHMTTGFTATGEFPKNVELRWTHSAKFEGWQRRQQSSQTVQGQEGVRAG